LSTVHPASAGSGAGMYGTATQIANAVGVAVSGAVFFSIQAQYSSISALFACLALFAGSAAVSILFLIWMRSARSV